MTINELIAYANQNGISLDANICIYTDYADDVENVTNSKIIISKDPSSISCPADAVWEYKNYKSLYDKDVLKEYRKNKNGVVSLLLRGI